MKLPCKDDETVFGGFGELPLYLVWPTDYPDAYYDHDAVYRYFCLHWSFFRHYPVNNKVLRGKSRISVELRVR